MSALKKIGAAIGWLRGSRPPVKRPRAQGEFRRTDDWVRFTAFTYKSVLVADQGTRIVIVWSNAEMDRSVAAATGAQLSGFCLGLSFLALFFGLAVPALMAIGIVMAVIGLVGLVAFSMARRIDPQGYFAIDTDFCTFRPAFLKEERKILRDLFRGTSVERETTGDPPRERFFLNARYGSSTQTIGVFYSPKVGEQVALLINEGLQQELRPIDRLRPAASHQDQVAPARSAIQEIRMKPDDDL